MENLRNKPNIRYDKAIHEFVKNFDGKTIVTKTNLLILHTGYSATLTKIKGERNLELLREEISQNETDELKTSQAYYMANTYGQLGDMAKAAEYADIAIEGSDDELGPMTVKMYRYILLREEGKSGGANFKTVMDILDEALLRVPDQPDFLIDKIRFYYPLKHYYEIETLCVKCINAVNNPEIMGRCESLAMTNLFYVYNSYADMLFHRGNIVEARRYIIMALKEKPKEIKILCSFVDYFRYEILDIVKPIIDQIYPEPTKEEKEFLKSAFVAMNYGDVYLRYVKPKSNGFEYYMCKGLYVKAAKLCEKELLELFKYAAFAYANFPVEGAVFKAAVPEKFLRGQKKQPQGTKMTIKDLMDKFVEVYSKLILACFSMTDDEFAKYESNAVKYMSPPAKEFLLAGYCKATQGIQLEDTKSFYEYIAHRGNRLCLSRLATAICVMPSNDEFLYNVIKDYVSVKAPQDIYNLSQKLQNKDYNYYIVLGGAFLYANDVKNARSNFIKARALGANTQELKDFIKSTDPAQSIVVTL